MTLHRTMLFSLTVFISLVILTTACILPSWSASTHDVSELKITEIMYNPPDVGLTDGNQFEFLELKNTGTTVIDLTGLSFTDGITYTFPPGTTLAAGEFFILASNAVSFQNKYGSFPDGTYTGQISNSGETLVLSDNQGTTIIRISYDDESPWPTTADGLGYSLVPIRINPTGDQNNPAEWRSSSSIGGSPRADDEGIDIPMIFINEALTNPAEGELDTVEIYNPNDTDVNISFWYLTDDRKEPKKYLIPAGTSIPAGGYMVFDENDFNANPDDAASFGLSSEGDEIYLFSGDNLGFLTGYSHGFEFKGAELGVPFARVVNSQGIEFFAPEMEATFGAANAAPKIGDIVITEIFYNSVNSDTEFIELYNRSDVSIALYNEENPVLTWHLEGGGYDFPPNTELPAKSLMLVVNIEPTLFRTQFNVPEDVFIVGPYPGTLQNDGETIRLQKPMLSEEVDIPYITIDEVQYDDDAPWPEAADGNGASIERIGVNLFGNEPNNWRASAQINGSPGILTAETSVPSWLLY